MAVMMPLELVLNFGSTVRRVHMVEEPTFAQVVEAIKSAYPNLNMDTVTVKYFDDDGDLCTLVDSTFTDFLCCLSKTAMGSHGVLFVELGIELPADTCVLELQEEPCWDFGGRPKGKGKSKAKGKGFLDFHQKGKGKAKGKGFGEWWWEAHGKGAEKGKGKCKGKDFEESWEDSYGKGEEKGKGKQGWEEELWLSKGKGKGLKGEDLEGWRHGPKEPWWESHGKGAGKGKGKCKGKDVEEAWADSHGKGEEKGRGKGKHSFEWELRLRALKGEGEGQKGNDLEEWWHAPEEPWSKGKGICKGKDFEEPWEDSYGKGEEKGKGKGKYAFEEQVWALKGKGKGLKGKDFAGWRQCPEEPWWEPHCKGVRTLKGKGKGKELEVPWPAFHGKSEIKGKGKSEFVLEDELWEVDGKGKGAVRGKGKGAWVLGEGETWEENDHASCAHPWWDEHGKGEGKKGKGKKCKAFEGSSPENHWLPEMEAIDSWREDTSGEVRQEEMTTLHGMDEDLNRRPQHHQLSSL